MESHQTSPFARSTQIFRGIRFVLLGFDPVNKAQVSRKLVNGGAVDAGQYDVNCTHVIVDKIAYDDPICVAARRDGKILVSGLWVEHSCDVGAPVDTTSVMYRPVRDLNGIPGAKSLVICLTGYQREDREDIMTMVDLMGAKFSKPLIANKVTHLLCYKFEGEKYMLAKKMKRIKLINHQWLEDCLKAWELLSEADYSKSGYELEMEAEAKDSEDEPEGPATRQNEGKIPSPREPKNVINGSAAEKNIIFKSPEKETRNIISTIDTNLSTSGAKRLHKFNFSDIYNMSSSLFEKINDRSETTLTGHSTPQKGRAFFKENEQKCLSSSKRKMDISDGSFKLQKMSQNEDLLNRENSFQELKKDPTTERKSLSSKGKNVICDVPISKTSTLETLQDEDLDAVQRSMNEYTENVVENVLQGIEKSSPSDFEKSGTPNTEIDEQKGASNSKEIKRKSTGKKFTAPDQNLSINVVENVLQGLENSSSSDFQKAGTPNTEINEQKGVSNSKTVKRKSTGKKFSAPDQNLSKNKTVNQKGSVYLKNIKPKNDATTSTVGVDDENISEYQMFEKSPPMTKSGREIEMEANDVLQNDNVCMDDETEPPEDKEEAINENLENVEPEKIVDIVMVEKTEKILHDPVDKSDDTENLASEKTSKRKKIPLNKKSKKKTALSVKEITDNKASKKKELVSDDNNEKPEVRKTKRNVSDLENSLEVKRAQGVCNDPEQKNDKKDNNSDKSKVRKTKRNVSDLENSIEMKRSKGVCNDPEQKADNVVDMDTENVVNKKETKRNKRPLSKTKKDATLSGCDLEAQKENIQIPDDDLSTAKKRVVKSGKEIREKVDKANLNILEAEPMWFILSGHKLQRREFQQIIRRLKGKVCRVSHQWSYQATHFIVPDPIRRTEKFFAAAASGRWILKTDYLSACNEAGKFLAEEPYEWHKNGLSEDGQINMEAPRKWRLLKEKTGHGAFYGMNIIIYGECISPPLDTLKRVVKAGDGTILATSPPYTRFLTTAIDFAVVSPDMPHVDIWVQEFIKHEIPCISADYLVEYVCKPGYPLEQHVQYDTNVWAERSFNNLTNRLNDETTLEPRTPDSNDVACEVCGSRDRGEEMLICGDDSGSIGCGVGTHIDCCQPPLDDVPEDDWFCPKCTKARKSKTSGGTKKRKGKKN